MKIQFSIRDLLWLLIVIALVLAWRIDRSRVRQWEYKDTQILAQPTEAELNKLGADGWEVCGYYFATKPSVILKREKR